MRRLGSICLIDRKRPAGFGCAGDCFGENLRDGDLC